MTKQGLIYCKSEMRLGNMYNVVIYGIQAYSMVQAACIYRANCATPVIMCGVLGVLCMQNTCITYVFATHGIHLYFYPCSTCIGYAPVLYV